jgi:hypothetical protein
MMFNRVPSNHAAAAKCPALTGANAPIRMAKPYNLQPLARILTTDVLLSSWHDRMRREAHLTTAVRRLLPRALADRVRVAEVTPPMLQLAVAGGAAAAVVRQRTPDILAGLRREGCDFTELRVRVQVGSDPPQPHKSTSKHNVKVDTAPLRRLARGLPEGPLKEAVERLVRRTG